MNFFGLIWSDSILILINGLALYIYGLDYKSYSRTSYTVPI